MTPKNEIFRLTVAWLAALAGLGLYAGTAIYLVLK